MITGRLTDSRLTPDIPVEQKQAFTGTDRFAADSAVGPRKRCAAIDGIARKPGQIETSFRYFRFESGKRRAGYDVSLRALSLSAPAAGHRCPVDPQAVLIPKDNLASIRAANVARKERRLVSVSPCVSMCFSMSYESTGKETSSAWEKCEGANLTENVKGLDLPRYTEALCNRRSVAWTNRKIPG